jgi:fructose/tagatose bisphosphate aldolase
MTIDLTVRDAVFAADPDRREAARRALTGRPRSIRPLYAAIAAGRAGGFTVPAFNLRGMVYDCARAVFRAARSLDAGAFVFEISRGEMGYTAIRPAEFAACVFGAALREDWTGPVFLQGDHFQFDRRLGAADRPALEALTAEAMDAGFLNIDVDASTLVDLSRPTLAEQQRLNVELTAALAAFIRGRRGGAEVSVGGEIGEVGTHASTVEEFEAFHDGCRGAELSKVSINAGTEHGGTVLPDGARAKVAVDFGAHRAISAAARKRGLAGTVQHGASTLPPELLSAFPDCGCVEIHLATEFQRTIFDHPSFPAELRERQRRWVEDQRPPEWKAGATPAQNFERAVKRTWGPMKREFWDLPGKDAILETLEARYADTMRRLGVAGTRRAVAEHVRT